MGLTGVRSAIVQRAGEARGEDVGGELSKLEKPNWSRISTLVLAYVWMHVCMGAWCMYGPFAMQAVRREMDAINSRRKPTNSRSVDRRANHLANYRQHTIAAHYYGDGDSVYRRLVIASSNIQNENGQIAAAKQFPNTVLDYTKS